MNNYIQQFNILFHSIEKVLHLKQATYEALKRLGIKNVRDLLFYKPVGYSVRLINPNLKDITDGALISLKVKIINIEYRLRHNKINKILASDGSSFIEILYFNQIPNFIKSILKIGNTYTIAGKAIVQNGIIKISHPDFIFDNKPLNAVEPVYSLTFGLTNRQLSNYIIQCLNIFDALITDDYIKLKDIYNNLCVLHLNKQDSITPDSKKYNSSIKYLAHKELLARQFVLKEIRATNHKKTPFLINKELQSDILNKLQINLTNSQINALNEIEKDQTDDKVMLRLLQGDVGSGKTIVALLTAINIVHSGKQVAIMAPTDLLAKQLYKFCNNACQNTGIIIKILTSNTPLIERVNILNELKSGLMNIIIGTHALFQEDIVFNNLGYVIIDEQHRFGVDQRVALINKSKNADVLIMSATPIPRTLALALYGDISVSSLKEKPIGRLPIITTTCSIDKISTLLPRLEEQLIDSSKVYWVCPLILQSDNNDLNSDITNVESRYEFLSNLYGDKVLKLHGKMHNLEKENIMNEFYSSNKPMILVATTIIEVGIDVPSANIIVIENAERFGLSALHQLRGRVGRSDSQSYCILLYNPKKLSKIGLQRLKVLCNTNDGFIIAEEDLKLRGSGDVLGIKQSGASDFFFIQIDKDFDLLEKTYNISNNDEKMQIIDFYIKLFIQDMPKYLN